MNLVRIFIVLVLIISFNVDALARRGGGGFSGSRSSFGSSSSGWGGSSRPSSSKPSTSFGWGGSSRPSSSKPSTSTSGWGGSSRPSTSTPSTSSPKLSAADQALYNKAKSSGTAYSTRSEATSAFKQKYGDQYKSTFASKPTTRPDYIPQSTTIGGRTYDISYNSTYGGYGYLGPSGSWIMYDAMADAATMSLLMNRHNYYYGNPQAYGNSSLSWVAAAGLIIVLLLFAIAFIGMNRYEY